jgi:hypothetical protein
MSVVGSVVEWFEEAADPYTYRLRLFVDQVGITLSQLLQISELTNRFAPTRSYLREFAVESNRSASLFLYPGSTVGRHVEIEFGGPAITGLSPLSGEVSSEVVITGINFTDATSVTFNGTSASFVVDSSTQITATVPVGATTGKVQVTTPKGSASSDDDFTVTSTFAFRSTIVSPTTPVASLPIDLTYAFDIWIPSLRGTPPTARETRTAMTSGSSSAL